MKLMGSEAAVHTAAGHRPTSAAHAAGRPTFPLGVMVPS
jgi:hypothetical protein